MRWRDSRGISLVEAAIVLMAISILTAAAAPSASRALDRARLARAVEDAEAIKTGIVNFRADVFQGFSEDGTTSGPQMEMLVSDGDIPRQASLTDDDDDGVVETLMRWDDPVGDEVPDNDSDGSGISVDFLEWHLVTNTIQQFTGTPAAYGLGGGNAWRGTYLNAPLDADPWGNRYAVNVKFLDAPSDTKMDTVVLSAGPDEEIDSLFERDGLYPGDDDVMVNILRDRNSSVP